MYSHWHICKFSYLLSQLSASLRNPFRNLSPVNNLSCFLEIIRDPQHSLRIFPNLTSATYLSMKLLFQCYLQTFLTLSIFRRITVPSLCQSSRSTSTLGLTSTSSSTRSLLYCAFLSYLVFSTVFSNLLTRLSSKFLLFSTIHSCHRILMPRISDMVQLSRTLQL